jgi:RHS repeat-associated protein
VNSSIANLYADSTFALGGFSLTDGSNTFTAIAKDSYGRVDTNTSICYLPATNSYSYDLNGNMLTNGNEVMVWNDDNELVTNFVAGSWKSDFVYDGRHRRRIERDYAWQGGAWVETNEIRFIYDGNVIIQQRDANNLPTLMLTRGNDLSGSLQGAGGIGGLLAMTENSGTSSYYHSDGNGNVTMLINANQIPVAKAEYDPYGNFLSLSGLKAGVNPYWFSSKPIHWQSGKYDYLLRWYIPDLDRFASQDPIQEAGGINLYAFVGNDSIGKVDYFGEDFGLGGPWGMGLYGLFGPTFISPPVSSAFVEEAKNSAKKWEDTLMASVKGQMKCGQSGTASVSQPTQPYGIGWTLNWQLDIVGNCSWICEKAQPPGCCCNCNVTCNFNGHFSKTWTWRPTSQYNWQNRYFWPLWYLTIEYQFGLYNIFGSDRYYMSGDFTDSRTMPIPNVCNK